MTSGSRRAPARRTYVVCAVAAIWGAGCGSGDNSGTGSDASAPDGSATVDSAAPGHDGGPAMGPDAASGNDAGPGDGGGSSDAADAGFPPGDNQPPDPVASQSPWTINSPDGNVVVTLALDGSGALSYAVDYAGGHVLGKARIGLAANEADFTSGLQYASGAAVVIDEAYAIPTGKRAPYVNHANELTLKFRKGAAEIDLVARAYDEGGAYRFAIPSGGSYTITSETGGFAVPAGITGFGAPPASDYQGVWDSQTEAQLTSSAFELPLLVKIPGGTWTLLTEAAVYGSVYWGSSVSGQPGLLSLQAGDGATTVTAPFQTPWRVAMVGTDLARIVESTMIENLNPPSEVTDTSWIKPGRSAWSWWSGDSTSDYATQQMYVDFASSMGWEYYLCDAGWDATWVPQIVAYAAAKGVGIWLWYQATDVDSDAKLSAVIAQAVAWGVKGLKVDYMFGDDLQDLARYDKVAQAAAQARLMINFHGCTKPSGERRRWPHLMTREAIYGAEQYKGNGDGPTARYNCILPFTRNAQGPMDYTPVTYSNMEGKTTYAHQTALDVVFESGVQHLADRPSSYTGNAAQPLLKSVPSHWDDTKLVEGDPGSYVTLARRSGTSWYVGSIADAARTATVPLSFLGAGMYQATLYEDGSSDTTQAVSQQAVTAATVLSVAVRQHGGFAAQLTPMP